MFKVVTATIAVTDLARAREFYEGKLGLKQSGEMTPEDGVLYQVGSTFLFIYQRPNAPTADHTLASFNVDNIDQTMTELSQKGVTFEHYDMPSLKTDEKGIATMGNTKSAWFKDPDGNILAILQT